MSSTPDSLHTADSAGSLPQFLRRGLPLWQSNALVQSRSWLQLCAAVALLIYAFFGISLETVPEKAAMLANLLGLVMLAVYGGPVNGFSLRRSAIVWLAVAAIVMALISWSASWLMIPEWAEPSFKVHRVTIWFAMIPVAVILGGRQRNVYLFWGCALLGLLLTPWISGSGVAEWQRGFAGERIDFGLHNAQHAAMLFATAALGISAFIPHFLGRGRRLLGLASLVLLAVCIAAVVATQTRGVWAGFIAGALTVAAIWVMELRKLYRRRRRSIFAGAITIAAGILAIGYLALGDIVSQRLAAEHEALQLLQQGQMEKIPDTTSAGVRLHTWREALNWIAEHPLVGWGGNGRSLIFDHSTNLSESIKQNFGHLHNSYLDLLANYGLLGLIVLVALVYWLVSRCLRSYRAGYISTGSFTFCLSFTVFFAVINVFESYLFYDSGHLVMALVGGGILTRIWMSRRAAANPQDAG
ncbi:O-antigen ligase family protein [Microbulbifer halophilus]|uniref:O-antigen ligase family protein n=1 Tax=Microbulbifer halophilus TaxID=453963 RepID=A0ABW5EB01_9GAMM|nr:O-antigen ligase family protein [Microbulbifer halophilus]MCW8126799.1 O-antigen ligase family protein [Microbulbifer halophilus]